MTEPALAALGWTPFFARQIQPDEIESTEAARICIVQRSQITLWSASAEFRLDMSQLSKLPPLAVGDWILVNAADRTPLKLLERASVLERKAAGHDQSVQLIAANVDVLLVLSSCNQEFNPNRLERYLALAQDTIITPVIVLTKTDLIDDPAPFIERAHTLRPGLRVVALDARDKSAISGLAEFIAPGRTLAMVGSSGVGKSTLASALGAATQATGEIRDEDGKGRHTTTWRSLLRLPDGGLLVDNPGMRELQLAGDDEALEDVFADLLEFANCRFADCAHGAEPGCGVRAAVERGDLDSRRLDSYLKLMQERLQSRESLEQRRQRERDQSRHYRSTQTSARRRKHKGDLD